MAALPDYRQAFLEILVEHFGNDFQAFAGDVFFDGTTKTRVSVGSNFRSLSNHYLIGRRFLWQTGAVTAGRGAGVAVLELNPRILSVWLSLLMRRMTRRPTLLWGHAWSRKGSASPTNVLRGAMRALADGVILYTHQQADELGAVSDRRRVFVAPNALYRSAEMEPAEGQDRTDFIYVGRLVAAKKPDLLLSAFQLALDRLPASTRLVFVGEGDLEEALRERARSLPADRVVFHGHVANPARLRAFYARAIASVSPGFVGLSITQSLGYGVPMIVARDEPHSPEIEAAIEGRNARFFQPTSVPKLADALVESALRPVGDAVRAEISADCRRRYSAEAMAAGFIDAIRAVSVSEGGTR
jgi:glycosyltransferase involved in cell wall biosynthesis